MNVLCVSSSINNVLYLLLLMEYRYYCFLSYSLCCYHHHYDSIIYCAVFTRTVIIIIVIIASTNEVGEVMFSPLPVCLSVCLFTTVITAIIIISVTSPLHESRLLWIHDPHRNQPSRVPPRQPPASQKIDTVPRTNNTVPRTNNTVPRSNNKVPRDSDNVPRNSPITQPLENIPSSVWHNSTLSSRSNNCPSVPRNNVTDRQSDQQKTVSPPPKKKRNRFYRRERRARERAERGETFNHDARWATQSPGAPSSTPVPDQLTQSGLLHSDPISTMRPAVYSPDTLVGRPTANGNAPFHLDQDLSESAGLLPGLYKPAVPDPQHHTWTSSFTANSLDQGPPSPPRTSEASSSSSRNRTGIVYPLQPRIRRPDVCITVEASLPEPAALHRPELQPTREAPTGLSRTHKRLSRKRRRNRFTAIYRPAKRSPPRGCWCDL